MMLFLQDAHKLRVWIHRKRVTKLNSRLYPLDVLPLLLCFILLGALMGAAVNGTNVWLSHTYVWATFRQVGDVWADLPVRFVWHGTWHRAIAGAIFGAFFDLHFAVLKVGVTFASHHSRFAQNHPDRLGLLGVDMH